MNLYSIIYFSCNFNFCKFLNNINRMLLKLKCVYPYEITYTHYFIRSWMFTEMFFYDHNIIIILYYSTIIPPILHFTKKFLFWSKRVKIIVIKKNPTKYDNEQKSKTSQLIFLLNTIIPPNAGSIIKIKYIYIWKAKGYSYNS